MNSKVGLLTCSLILFVLAGCSIPATPQQVEFTKTPSLIVNSATPVPSPLATNTPIPTPTLTPTESLPTTTPTSQNTLTPTPTFIPLDVQLRIFESLWSIVNDTYVYSDFNGLDWNAIHQEYRQKIISGLTNDQFYQAMIETIHRLGDEHSVFLDPQEEAEQEVESQGDLDYVGIGVLVGAVPERMHAVILSVFPHSPAEAAGLQPRDSIISVDGIPILDRFGFLQDIVRGPEGTSILLSVQTPGENPREIRITRHRITGNVPVEYRVINTPSGERIGYILLVTFNDNTVDEQVADALRQMTAEGPLDGLVLDNRMNDGGSSTVLEPMLGYFADGTLGYYIKRDEELPLQIELNDINGSSQVPLVVLVGSGTASFGEIYAGILQDIQRAYLIGQTTDGNVEILWSYDFEDGSRLWLANGTFRAVNHPDQDWEKTGIIPDLSVTGEFDEYSLENDPAVLAAVQYLSLR